MKSFLKYLVESKKTYNFKVRLANCDLNDNELEKIKVALQQFDLVKMSKIKNYPIEDRSDEFPRIGACEVKEFDVELNYPTTDAAVRQAIAHATTMGLDQTSVYTQEGYVQRLKELDRTKKKDSSLLDKEELDSEPKPKLDLDFLKNLESRKYDFAASTNEKAKTTNELPQGTLSPVGSKQNKIPSPMGMKK